jgi:hypothetical protein
LLAITLVGCGESDPPYIGDWVVDAKSSLEASPRMFNIMNAIERLATAEITIGKDVMVTRNRGYTGRKSFVVVARDDGTFELGGDKKNGAFIVKVLTKDRIAVRGVDDITLILDRKKG